MKSMSSRTVINEYKTVLAWWYESSAADRTTRGVTVISWGSKMGRRREFNSSAWKKKKSPDYTKSAAPREEPFEPALSQSDLHGRVELLEEIQKVISWEWISCRLNATTAHRRVSPAWHGTDESRWTARLGLKGNTTALHRDKKKKEEEGILPCSVLFSIFLWARHRSLNFTLLKCSVWHYRMRRLES